MLKFSFKKLNYKEPNGYLTVRRPTILKSVVFKVVTQIKTKHRATKALRSLG